ncbi:hypothetical protein K1719_012878 [Acacia pycnantha]|nr:hypothetical protein K1719_012878 [Acacia pycnantha]
MLQIRLSKLTASEGSSGLRSAPVETAIACPEHLVLADLSVAKGIGAATATSLIKIVGRRSRRQLGDRVHFCVRCDFPIAIYGRLSPCEHAFCLDCARSDPMCCLCDERIQKIQSIKMMEGIFLCAAPHCLKSFLKKTEFESHIQENHSDLLRHNAEREDGNESEAQSVRQSTASDSTARGPQRPLFSPGSKSQLHDWDDKSRQQPIREQPPSRPIQQPKPPYFGQAPNPSLEPQSGNNGAIQQDFHPQSFERQQGVTSETPIRDYPHNVVMQVNPNALPKPPMAYSYPPYPQEGAQPFYASSCDMPRQNSTSEIGLDQRSLLGYPPGPVGGPNFPANYAQAWNAGMTGVVPFDQAQGGMIFYPRDAKGP